MKIFISHSSKDKYLVDAFVEKILISGCGINEKNIFCTSIEGLGIKTGNDFRNHILSELLTSDYSFLLISNNYKKSDICLNEMGASWALKNLDVKPFLFPNVDFNSIGTLYNVKQASRLNDSFALDNLFEELTNRYEITKSITRWNKFKLNFIESIDNYQEENKTFLNPSPEEYFGKYVKEGASINQLLLEAHPTLLDCKAIFSKDYYSKIFQWYCFEFEQFINNHMEPLYPKYSAFRYKKNSSIEMMSGKNILAGGMGMAAEKGAFKYDVVFYCPEFLKESESQSGILYNVFSYVNNRWVFLPKPWRGIL
ncbi:MAG: toll/interleukin-1 receptor domain-containing protein [Flavobacteriales bacterium]|nr:toll/interleukin-1 receptor domain-containing protein [Flavobacteriales bacterium]